MPVMTLLVDGTIPVAEDFNGNWRRLNQAIGTNTSLTNIAQGDLLYGSTTDTLARRAIGASGEVLTVVGGVPVWSSSGAVSGTWQQRNLVGTLTTGALTVSADSVMLRNSALAVKVHEAVSGITIDPASAGLNGRDQTLAFSAGQDLYAYWISDGTTIRGVWADSAPVTGPDLTTLAAFAGYTYWGLIGVFKWTATSVFFPSHLRGTTVYYDAPAAALSDGAATTEATVALATWVPAAALETLLHCSAVPSVGGLAPLNNPILRVVTGLNFYRSLNNSGNASGSALNLALAVPNIAQQVFYLWTNAPAANNGLYLSVAGYRVANGGE